jgi:hypothetical protein
MAQQTAEGETRAPTDSPLLTYMRTRLKHADPWAVASALLEALARDEFEHALASEIESVKIEAAERVLAVTGKEAAVREVSEFVKRADKKDEMAGATESNWVEQPGTPAAPPLTGVADLHADFVPEDADVDDFIAMVRESRRSRRSRQPE